MKLYKLLDILIDRIKNKHATFTYVNKAPKYFGTLIVPIRKLRCSCIRNC